AAAQLLLISEQSAWASKGEENQREASARCLTNVEQFLLKLLWILCFLLTHAMFYRVWRFKSRRFGFSHRGEDLFLPSVLKALSPEIPILPADPVLVPDHLTLGIFNKLLKCCLGFLVVASCPLLPRIISLFERLFLLLLNLFLVILKKIRIISLKTLTTSHSHDPKASGVKKVYHQNPCKLGELVFHLKKRREDVRQKGEKQKNKEVHSSLLHPPAKLSHRGEDLFLPSVLKALSPEIPILPADPVLVPDRLTLAIFNKLLKRCLGFLVVVFSESYSNPL
ncbi:hypothetical protein AMECASPLE_034401, partial [Ameca splendens]